MRSSAVLAIFGATLAVASPVHQALHKKAIEYEIVTDIVYVTVTAGHLPSTTSKPDTTVVVQHTVFVNPVQATPSTTKTKTKTKTTPPPPPPTTTSVPPPPPPPPSPTVVVPAPAPTPEAPPPAVKTTPQALKVAPPPPPPAPAAAAPTDYISTALYHHKVHRANHTAGELTWDDTLAGYAETIAKGCVFAHDMTQGGGGYGQNLAAYGTTSDLSSLDPSSLVADAITNQWYYGEAANVPYGVDSPSISGPEFLHLTQLVWKGTTKVGCATVQCGAGTIFSYGSLYTVCNYRSTGNVMGSFSSEVSRPIGNPPISAVIS